MYLALGLGDATDRMAPPLMKLLLLALVPSNPMCIFRFKPGTEYFVRHTLNLVGILSHCATAEHLDPLTCGPVEIS